MNPNFSFIILTYNEEAHLPRLLDSIVGLQASTFVLDSGSTDHTISICEAHRVCYAIHPFENHPKQWHRALNSFDIHTPWVIGLDADQRICSILYQQLKTFDNNLYTDIDGIYFNRKNIFKGKWIKYGGFYPRYMLKMFKYDRGYSDLNENMDHRFIVPGTTIIWKTGALIEENLKENKISFWLDKHNRYSDLLATEEIERMQQLRKQLVKPYYWGTPDQRIAWLKNFWWQLPLYIRPILYLCHRLFLQRGILDGRTGILYHFLQSFWFRLIVDMKIEEKLKLYNQKHLWQKKQQNIAFIKFLFFFPTLFAIIYTLNLAFIGITTPGGLYLKFADQYLNYIDIWRSATISSTAALLELLNYDVVINDHGLHVQGRSGFRMVYTCLGYGILSLFVAFIVSFPTALKSKLVLCVSGVITFQCLNTLRLLMIALYWKPSPMFFKQNAHEVFNYAVYLLLASFTYIWIEKRL